MNKNTKILKICLDVLMTIVIILLMNSMITGMTIHEIIGIAILIVAIIHNILNMKWIKAMTQNLFRRDVPIKGKIMYIINFIAFIVLTADVITGILISEALFPNIQISDRQAVVSWHHLLSYWLLIIISVHIGLHWDLIVNSFKNLLNKWNMKWQDSIVVKIIFKIAYIAIAIAGIISLAKPDIHDNFILQNNNNLNKQNNNISQNDSSSTSSSNQTSTSGDSNDSTKKTTGLSTISSVTVDEVTSLQDYLGKLYCTGCGRHCPLTNPQCNKGQTRQEQEIENYNDMYGTSETYSSSGSSSNQSSTSSQTTKSTQSNSSTNNTNPNTNTNSNSSTNASTSTNSNVAKKSKGSIPESTDSKPPIEGENTNTPTKSFNGNANENLKEQNDNNANLMDYVWIMGFVIGGTYYVAKLPKIMKKKDN